MASPKSKPPQSILIFLLVLISRFFIPSHSSDLLSGDELAFGRRGLMSFKEKVIGSGVVFECSPTGPCVACVYSEKNDEKYRCSETGYRIPLKCVKSASGTDEGKAEKTQKGRSTVESSNDIVKAANVSEAYDTYRSCIPAVNQEKLSVLGFEAVILSLLIISGSVVLFRRRRMAVMPGTVRGSANSRF